MTNSDQVKMRLYSDAILCSRAVVALLVNHTWQQKTGFGGVSLAASKQLNTCMSSHGSWVPEDEKQVLNGVRREAHLFFILPPSCLRALTLDLPHIHSTKSQPALRHSNVHSHASHCV